MVTAAPAGSTLACFISAYKTTKPHWIKLYIIWGVLAIQPLKRAKVCTFGANFENLPLDKETSVKLPNITATWSQPNHTLQQKWLVKISGIPSKSHEIENHNIPSYPIKSGSHGIPFQGSIASLLWYCDDANIIYGQYCWYYTVDKLYALQNAFSFISFAMSGSCTTCALLRRQSRLRQRISQV